MWKGKKGNNTRKVLLFGRFSGRTMSKENGESLEDASVEGLGDVNTNEVKYNGSDDKENLTQNWSRTFAEYNQFAEHKESDRGKAEDLHARVDTDRGGHEVGMDLEETKDTHGEKQNSDGDAESGEKRMQLESGEGVKEETSKIVDDRESGKVREDSEICNDTKEQRRSSSGDTESEEKTSVSEKGRDVTEEIQNINGDTQNGEKGLDLETGQNSKTEIQNINGDTQNGQKSLDLETGQDAKEEKKNSNEDVERVEKRDDSQTSKDVQERINIGDKDTDIDGEREHSQISDNDNGHEHVITAEQDLETKGEADEDNKQENSGNGEEVQDGGANNEQYGDGSIKTVVEKADETHPSDKTDTVDPETIKETDSLKQEHVTENLTEPEASEEKSLSNKDSLRKIENIDDPDNANTQQEVSHTEMSLKAEEPSDSTYENNGLHGNNEIGQDVKKPGPDSGYSRSQPHNTDRQTAKTDSTKDAKDSGYSRSYFQSSEKQTPNSMSSSRPLKDTNPNAISKFDVLPPIHRVTQTTEHGKVPENSLASRSSVDTASLGKVPTQTSSNNNGGGKVQHIYVRFPGQRTGQMML